MPTETTNHILPLTYPGRDAELADNYDGLLARFKVGEMQNAALKKEIERLCAALQEIADLSPSSFERSDDPSSVIEWAQEALNHGAA